jgi:hypothetical protein
MPTSAEEVYADEDICADQCCRWWKRYHRYWQIPYHVLEITGDRRYLKKIGKLIKLLTLIYRWQEASNLKVDTE